jgi:chemotaxis signal transduction protein
MLEPIESIEVSLDSPVTVFATEPNLAPAQSLAQGVICGPWALALSYDWARQIIENFELTAIPKAPPWLLGATNVEGSILPVVDLGLYFSPELGATSATQTTQRLLVGGMTADSAEDAVAIAFHSLPQQLRYSASPLDYAGSLPPKLREVCDAVAHDASGNNFLEINSERLLAALSDELSQL